jgi:excisionase family DNA binding protein
MTRRGRATMLTTSGVARMLYVHINTVRRWSDQGILKPYRIGPRGDRRFLRDDIIEYLNTQQYGGGDGNGNGHRISRPNGNGHGNGNGNGYTSKYS